MESIKKSYAEAVSSSEEEGSSSSPPHVGSFRHLQEQGEEEAIKLAIFRSLKDQDAAPFPSHSSDEDDMELLSPAPGFCKDDAPLRKRKKTPTYESWEEEELHLGEPVLPLGSFRYRKSKSAEEVIDLTSSPSPNIKSKRNKRTGKASPTKIERAYSSSEESEVEFSLKGVKETDVNYLRGNTNLPYIPWEDNFSNEMLTEFLLDPPTFAVCLKERPTVCQVNAIFTIDTRSLKDEHDIKSDDFAWRNNGTKVHEVLINDTKYRLNKTYFVHKKYKDFKRRIYSLRDNDEKNGQYLMMCYLFQNSEPHSVSPAKKARTQKSTLKSIVQRLKQGSSARDVYQKTRTDAGGILNAATLSALPKSVKQIQKLKERSNEREPSVTSTSTKKDQLFQVILKCVEESHWQKARFIQFVQGAPQPLAFLADNRQLNDIERFCTNKGKPGIISIDTTYNCGAFYVTPTTYKHQMLVSKRTGKHPVMLGPAMIHKHKDAEAFSYLGSCLTRKKPSLRNILSIGCDRDKAIKNGLSSSFPEASFLACKKHFEDDLKRKLTELGINGTQRTEILVDIMGSDVTRE